ncbi:DUF1178 family protein [Novosphingobium sp. PS1R-30]|uniref:DUF1178 family protein n=1 Tax=Novosphingobium anseongense TaxID=3133436 RepID=A0ABU8RSN2_9SPHN
MIVFDLQCREAGHRFEGWFGSSGDFVAQQERGLVSCPECGSAEVIKSPMAPNLGRKGNQLAPVPVASSPAQPMTKAPMPAEAIKLMHALHAMQAEALKDSRWVGDKFAEESRAMHYGERDAEIIHGQATREEAEALADEGIEVAPLPFPVAPPGEAN